MKAYTFFAKVYDEFMQDIPYVDWVDMIEEYLEKNGKKVTNILELGCGTGRFSRLLAADGYSVTGIDLSKDMIKVAKKTKLGLQVKYSVQDMRCFECDEQYDIIVSVCDSMNYLLNEEELKETFLCVKKYLKKDGLFIFDLKTEKYYEKLGENIFTDEKDKVQYFWENDYDSKTRNNEYYISFFVKRGKLYQKIVEEHTQHAFTNSEICNASKEAGLMVKENLNINMSGIADFDEDRVYYILEIGE